MDPDPTDRSTNLAVMADSPTPFPNRSANGGGKPPSTSVPSASVGSSTAPRPRSTSTSRLSKARSKLRKHDSSSDPLGLYAAAGPNCSFPKALLFFCFGLILPTYMLLWASCSKCDSTYVTCSIEEAFTWTTQGRMIYPGVAAPFMFMTFATIVTHALHVTTDHGFLLSAEGLAGSAVVALLYGGLTNLDQQTVVLASAAADAAPNSIVGGECCLVMPSASVLRTCPGLPQSSYGYYGRNGTSVPAAPLASTSTVASSSGGGGNVNETTATALRAPRRSLGERDFETIVRIFKLIERTHRTTHSSTHHDAASKSTAPPLATCTDTYLFPMLCRVFFGACEAVPGSGDQACRPQLGCGRDIQGWQSGCSRLLHDFTALAERRRAGSASGCRDTDVMIAHVIAARNASTDILDTAHRLLLGLATDARTLATHYGTSGCSAFPGPRCRPQGGSSRRPGCGSANTVSAEEERHLWYFGGCILLVVVGNMGWLWYMTTRPPPPLNLSSTMKKRESDSGNAGGKKKTRTSVRRRSTNTAILARLQTLSLVPRKWRWRDVVGLKVLLVACILIVNGVIMLLVAVRIDRRLDGTVCFARTIEGSPALPYTFFAVAFGATAFWSFYAGFGGLLAPMDKVVSTFARTSKTNTTYAKASKCRQWYLLAVDWYEKYLGIGRGKHFIVKLLFFEVGAALFQIVGLFTNSAIATHAPQLAIIVAVLGLFLVSIPVLLALRKDSFRREILVFAAAAGDTILIMVSVCVEPCMCVCVCVCVCVMNVEREGEVPVAV